MASLLSVRRAAATPVHTNFQSFWLSGSKNRGRKKKLMGHVQINTHTKTHSNDVRETLDRTKCPARENEFLKRERELFLF